ncbi:MAG: FtsX-like permease family protein [Thermodesulfobacteriota bacterium]|nr:FtsX-like permease family protein [Thermodesulfobacteriota bacterium]
MLLVKIGWRNILRNKKKMMPAGLAIMVSLAGLIFLDALFIGMNENMIGNATDTFLGNGQIHARDFTDTLETEKTINHIERVVSQLSFEDSIRGFTMRTQTYGMLSSPSNVESVVLVGICPETERDMSKIDEAVIEGEFLNDDDTEKVLIGKKLSEMLDVRLHDRIVITVAQVKSGELAQELFRVGGIFRFNIRAMDRGIAFISLKKSQELLGIGQNVHEVVLKFHRLADVQDRGIDFWNRYSVDGNEALSWKDLLPGLEAAFKMSRFSSFLMGGLLFIIVVIVVMNTLFMSLYERMFEFGILRAIGTRPIRMASMILVEAGLLSVVSILLGSALGVAISYIVSITGVDYTGLELAGVTFREPIRPVTTVWQLTLFPICVFVFTLVAAIFPALHASRLIPAEAMKESQIYG